MQTKEVVHPLKDKHGNLFTDNHSQCAILNEYFCSVFTREISCHTVTTQDEGDSSQQGQHQRSEMEMITIDEFEVMKRLKSLDRNKAAGYDKIPAILLIELADALYKPITLLFTKSISSGEVPSEWKKANVAPLFKKGERCQPGNYRPVSLTSHVCKVLEGIIKDHITKYLNTNNSITSSQHGFVKGKSCLTNLLEYLTFVQKCVDNNKPVDVIYLDFQKAFDTVPHMRLVDKLQANGITGSCLKWIKNWLSGREQRVVIKDSSSEWGRVLSGVPQGSVLGPLLFVIYINDIDRNIVSRLSKFADDTKVYNVVSDIAQYNQIQEDLNKVLAWSESWLMSFNVSKCKVMHLGRQNPRLPYTLNGTGLSITHEERDLGVLIQDDLKVNLQCSEAVKKANKILGCIYRSIDVKSSDVILRLYKSLVRPHLEYCIQAWRPHLQKDIDKLEGVQHRATKMITSLSRFTYEQRLMQLNLTTLETRRLRGDLIEVFKIVRGFSHVDFNSFFQLAKFNFRNHKFKLNKDRFNKDIGKFCFVNRVVDVWNSLDEEVVLSDSVNIFKNRIDKFFELRGYV